MVVYFFSYCILFGSYVYSEWHFHKKMMDLERSIGGPKGIPDRYSFTQTPTKCIITFPIPPRTKIQCLIDQSENSIFAISDETEPVVSGITYGKFYKASSGPVNNVFTIELYKEVHSPWPILISRPCSHGIDMKSVYTLGISYDAIGKSKEAFEKYKDSADRGYVPAKVLMADIYLSDINNYGVTKNIDIGLQYLESIPIDKRSVEVTKHISNIYHDMKKEKESCNAIRSAIVHNNSSELKLLLARKLSPITKGTGEAEEAVSLLEDLASEYNTEAMQFLALHLARGCGTKKNKQRAKEIDAKACELDPTLKPIYGTGGIGTNIAIASLVTGAFVGTCAFLWNKFK